ncbi:hypothetical protein EGW08_004102, partial [Elysia chlorotica]
MADLSSGTAVEGTPETGKDGGTPVDITPSRRSSRKKQSTFSDDFEYYTPTGRKKEEEKKISPQQPSKENESDNLGKKLPKKVGQRKPKGKNAEEEEENDEDEVEVLKPKVGKGKLKQAVKKTGKNKPASPKKKTATRKQVSSEAEDEDGEEEDEEESEEASSDDDDEEEEESKQVKPGKKRKAAGTAKKKQPGKAGRKKKKVEEVQEEESSSDEDDSTPISQLQAQLKQRKAGATKEYRESPLAQNLAKKLLEMDTESSASVGEEDTSPAAALGQKRKTTGESITEPSPAKKTAKVSQFQNLGTALASLVKRIPPADLGLVKRSPNEIAAKVGKQATVSAAAVKENNTSSSEKAKSVSIEESKPVEVNALKQSISIPEDNVNKVGKVKQEDVGSDKKPNISVLDKKKTVKFNTDSVSSSNKSLVKSEKDKIVKGSEGSIIKKIIKVEEKQTKDKQSKPMLPKDGKISVLSSGQKPGKESLVKKESSTGKPQKLSESELRQKKIEQIKAKIAEKSAGQRSFLEEQGKSKPSDGSRDKHVVKKEGLKDGQLVKRKLEHVKSKVDASSKKFSNIPPNMLKKKSEVKGHNKSHEDLIKRGIVVKKKSHPPFGTKNVRMPEKSPNSKHKSDATNEKEKEGKIDRDKLKKSEDSRRKSSEGERRKSSETKVERQLSNEGNKKQRKISAGEDSGSKDINKGANGDAPPVLTPASAAVQAKSSKHKHHKPEHEVPIDMSMMDLFKPDGLIVHDPATTALPTTETNPQPDSVQRAPSSSLASSSNPGSLRPQDVHHVLLEHQYSKTSEATDSADANERGLSTAGANHQQKSSTLAGKKDDVESMSHNNRSVIMDVSLPEQILQEPSEDLVTSTKGEPTDAKDEGGKPESAGSRTCILESLDTELKESGTDFLIVGQVEVCRQTAPEVSETSTPAPKQKSEGLAEGKKGSEAAQPSATPSTRKRKDSDRSSESRKKSTDSQSSESRKKSTDSQSSTADKKKSSASHKNDQKKRKSDGKEKEKEKDGAAESGEESGEDEEFEDDENDFDWEDPDMLYCLCRKPHNNRFMICCDKCEEWYHGTCVGITRARGKEMEDNEEEYTCPICIKGDGISLLEKAPVSTKSTDMSSPGPKLLQKCVGRKCSKTPRAGSVYCSNECIMNHAQESLKAIRDEQAKKASKEKHHSSQQASSGKSSSSSSKVPPSPSSSSDVVEVMERETGKILRGPSAPTQKGLHRWLEQHPSFEVVQPHKHRSSSKDSRDSKDDRSADRKDRRSSSSSSSSSKDKKSGSKSDEKSHRHHDHHHKDPSRRESSGGSSSSSSREHSSSKKIDSDRRSSSSSASHKTEGSSSHSSSHRKEEKRSERSSSGGPNQIRINVRTGLRDCLYARAKEAEDILLSSNEIKAIALEIEEKLYDLFNDTGHKYRAKYRSLIFNIKDQKNKGLFRKILGGKISPDKLVLMSTEDLASRELAKWREQESKHQIEMIEKLEKEKQETKSTNHVTKKTHKGEIEVNDEDLSTLETRLEEKKETEPDKADEQAHEPAIDTTSQHRAHLFDLNCKVCTGKIVPGLEEQTAASKALPAKPKKTGVVHFVLPGDEEKEEKPEPKLGNTSIHHHHTAPAETEKKELEEEDYEKAAEIVKEALEHVHKAEEELSSLPSMVSSSPKHHEPALSPPLSPREEPEDMDMDDDGMDLDLERQADDDVNASPAKVSGSVVAASVSSALSAPSANASSSSSVVLSAAAEKKVVVRSPDSALQSGLEAKAKFNPTSPVLWKGFVSMLDVAKFFTSAYRVSGPVDHISIPDTVHIMGRISPDHMWDYLSKIRQAGSKDITVLRFIPGSDEEKVAYIHLYSYLNSRARCGVANNLSRQVKDFYIVPLASHSKIPRTLLPFDGPGLEENRPHMLIGILVRQRDKYSKDTAALDSDSPRSSSSSSRKSDKVSSSSSAGTDGVGGGGEGYGSAASGKAKTTIRGPSRDPRLAKLAAKADSPKDSPSGKGNSVETKPKEAQPSVESEEYDPEYTPSLGKAKGSQPVAEYIPTPTAKTKDKHDQKLSGIDGKKAGKSKTPSPEDSGGSDSKEKHHHSHHHHHHHHKERHRHKHHHKGHGSHDHDRKVDEDDSEPYSPSKEAEPYSPGMEAAAEEPYDPEDESLMDEQGHPLDMLTSEKKTAAAATTQASGPAKATTTTTTTVDSASVVTSTTTTKSANSGSGTATSAAARSDDGKSSEDSSSLSSEELVERMARSNDPGQISSLMVLALSQASTQQE